MALLNPHHHERVSGGITRTGPPEDVSERGNVPSKILWGLWGRVSH